EIDPFWHAVAVDLQHVPFTTRLVLSFQHLHLVAGDADDGALAVSQALAFGYENPAALQPVEIACCSALRPEERGRRSARRERRDQQRQDNNAAHGCLLCLASPRACRMLSRRTSRWQDQAEPLRPTSPLCYNDRRRHPGIC